MTKHTLLATIGTSPQIVTETLYAIHHEKNHQWPDDIYLITTKKGEPKAVEGLLEKGHLQRLCEELNRPMPKFDATHVLVTPGADGTEVEDARSKEDHAALANFITAQVRERTASPDTTLHASLAGGRKTMTFYIGYAMSLFGRAQDTLSHVLISEGYENIPDFWFPTQAEAYRYVDNRGQKQDASAAKVTLAPIPFVRLREGLPKALLAGDTNFSQTVDAIQQSLEPPRLHIYRSDDGEIAIECGIQIIKLPPDLMAWFIWWAEQEDAISGPTEASEKKGPARRLSGKRFLDIYAHVLDPQFLYSGVNVFFSPMSDPDYKTTFDRLKKDGGISKDFFLQKNSKLKKELEKNLGQYKAANYLVKGSGGYGKTHYRLALPKDAISIDL